MLNIGDSAPEIYADSINNQHITLKQLKGRKVLIKFHRFSGCPIAQNHIHEFMKRQQELNATGIESIIFLHSSPDKIASSYSEVPGLHIIGDKSKTFYKLYGVEFSWKKFFTLHTWKETIASIFKGYPPLFNKFEGGIIGLPSDFLVDENGNISNLHFGKHYGDSWSVDEVLKISK
ncbi:MAG: redoxin domain-containing protein [Bacteroidetes bacterium]|nr:redoxin domain-containing protein [Bacteroidota bacterium]